MGYNVGMFVKVTNCMVLAKTDPTRELLDPVTNCSVKLKFIRGRSRVEVLTSCPEVEELLTALQDPYPAARLDQLSLEEIREPRLRGSFCNMMGCVRLVNEEQMVNGKSVREVRIVDETSDCVIVKLWEPEQIRMAGSWVPRHTVVFLSNVMIEYDHYRGCNVLAGSSRSILTVQPSLWETAALQDHTLSLAFSPVDRLHTFISNSHSRDGTRNLTVEGLRQLAQVGAASEHSSLLFVDILGRFSETNLPEASSVSLLCTGCRGPVVELEPSVFSCELFACPASDGATVAAEELFTVTASVTDDTGTFENIEVHEDFIESLTSEPGAGPGDWKVVLQSTKLITKRLFLTIFSMVTLAVELPLRSHSRPLRMIAVDAERKS